jgi:hypothetical protein
LSRRSPPPAEVILARPPFFLSLPGLPWRIGPTPAVKSSLNCRLYTGDHLVISNEHTAAAAGDEHHAAHVREAAAILAPLTYFMVSQAESMFMVHSMEDQLQHYYRVVSVLQHESLRLVADIVDNMPNTL